MRGIQMTMTLILGMVLVFCSATSAGERAAAKTGKQDQEILVEAGNRFALDLYRELGAKPGNVLFSPYSIHSALGMVSAGARGRTEKEILRTLRIPLEAKRLHPAASALLRELLPPPARPMRRKVIRPSASLSPTRSGSRRGLGSPTAASSWTSSTRTMGRRVRPWTFPAIRWAPGRRLMPGWRRRWEGGSPIHRRLRS